MQDLERYAKYLSRTETEAQDLVQITFEKSWKNFHRFTRASNLKAWLFKIMYNSFIDGIRSNRFSEHDHHQFLEQIVDPKHEVTTLIDLDQAIHTLEPELRCVLVLATIEGYDYKTIAKTMGIPQGTVMSRLHRARSVLRELMARPPKNPVVSSIRGGKDE